MAGDLDKFLDEVRRDARAQGAKSEAELDAYLQHFETARQVLELRRIRHMTQTDLAQASGIQQSEISRIERGQGNPTLHTMGQLARALGVRVAFVPAGEYKRAAAPGRTKAVGKATRHGGKRKAARREPKAGMRVAAVR